ncbi:hypothetical protein [Deinococcus hopiensis]|uniref:Aminoglycoside 3-N-acetyltransferase n=1 Tax=Deinococcus hopiensis KR-140 TaxID=695939 RepID=A0A1W1VRX0_9DEIO|nr:aminoglycoside 3-N-acetyltransferase [Deinococcus hopiensis KR-140]
MLLGNEKNTSLHLAEVRAGKRGTVSQAAPIPMSGERQWITLDELDDGTFHPSRPPSRRAER